MRTRCALSTPDFEAAFLREKSLSDRDQRAFTMVIFVPRDVPMDAAEEQLDGLADVLQQRSRASDTVGMLDRKTVAVLLPVTGEAGARAMGTSVLGLLEERGLRFEFRVCKYAACPPHDRDDRRGGGRGGSGGSGKRRNGRRSKRPVAEQAVAQGAPRAAGSPAAELARSSSLPESPQPTAVATPLAAPTNSIQLDQVDSVLHSEHARALRTLCFKPVSARRRAMDIIVSGSMLVVLSPLLLITALAVKLGSPGPILFKQQRAGQGGEPFTFIKFRSMYLDAEQRKAALAASNEKDGPIFKMKNDPRMTPIGRWIRRASIDELPQLYHVLLGDMTLVGPRPPTLDEVDNYLPWQRERLNLKGGLTCIWQVSGRSEIGFKDWVRMDVRYGRERGMAMDLSLLAKTARAVVSGRGAY